MNDNDIIRIFKDLKELNFIEQNRNEPRNQTGICCIFQANPDEVVSEYNSKHLEFFNEFDVIWSLLHEEGHLREKKLEQKKWFEKNCYYFINRKSFSEACIIDEDIADNYAALKLLEPKLKLKFPELNLPPSEVMKIHFKNIDDCGRKHKFCLIKSRFKKLIWGSRHRPNNERIQRIRNLYEKPK